MSGEHQGGTSRTHVGRIFSFCVMICLVNKQYNLGFLSSPKDHTVFKDVTTVLKSFNLYELFANFKIIVR